MKFNQTLNIIHSHGGGADGQMALLLLKTMTHVNLLGVVVMPAESLLIPALSMTNAIAGTTPVFCHDVETPDKFPDAWKLEAIEIQSAMKVEENQSCQNINDLIDLIKQNKNITFIETGPLTVLAACIDRDPDVVKCINHVIWTGGSFDDTPSRTITDFKSKVDGTQSWNALVDPYSAITVLNSDLKLTLFPRELTHTARLTREFYENLPDTPNGNIYKDVYAKYLNTDNYYLWDVLTSSYVGCDIFKTEIKPIDIVLSGTSVGKTIIASGKVDIKDVNVVISANLEAFYKYLLEQLTLT